jgi:hypothetical protein
MVLDSKSGYYLQRVDGGSTLQAVILGDVDVAASVDIVINAGYNLIAFPYPIDVGVNDDEFVSLTDGAAGSTSPFTSDTVYKYNGTSFDSAWLAKAPGNPLDDTWMGPSGASTLILEAGVGFYYEHVSTGFTWTVERPFGVD